MNNINDIDLIESFLEKIAAEDGLSKNSIISYSCDLKLFYSFANKKDLSFISIKDADIRSYIEDLHKQNIKSSSLSRKISALRNFFNFLESEKLIEQNPLKNIENPKKQNKLPKFLSIEEVFKLLDFAEKDNSEFGIRLSCILEILYGSGLRISELVNLPISSIQKDENNKIKNYLIIKGKGNKERITPLSKSSLNKLLIYLDLRDNIGQKQSKWLFPGNIRSSKNAQIIKKKLTSKEKDQPITRQRINQMLKELATKSGLNPDIIHPHILRHSFATHLLNKGINIRYLQEMLGHATISTTEIYTYIMDDKLQELLFKHHPLNNNNYDRRK